MFNRNSSNFLQIFTVKGTGLETMRMLSDNRYFCAGEVFASLEDTYAGNKCI